MEVVGAADDRPESVAGGTVYGDGRRWHDSKFSVPFTTCFLPCSYIKLKLLFMFCPCTKCTCTCTRVSVAHMATK